MVRLRTLGGPDQGRHMRIRSTRAAGAAIALALMASVVAGCSSDSSDGAKDTGSADTGTKTELDALRVPQEYKTIQAAVNAAKAGDLVLVDEGVYKEAVDVTGARTGRAFIVSALTAIAGVAVISFSSMPLLRDFGRVVGMNVAVALLSALVVLPPMLVWADKWGLVSKGMIKPQEPMIPVEPDGKAHG